MWRQPKAGAAPSSPSRSRIWPRRRTGCACTIRRSKTDQEGQGAEVAILRGYRLRRRGRPDVAAPRAADRVRRGSIRLLRRHSRASCLSRHAIWTTESNGGLLPNCD